MPRTESSSLERLGWGPTILVGLFIVLALVGVAQIYFIAVGVRELRAAVGDFGMPWWIWLDPVVLAVKTLLLALAAVALVTQREPASVKLAIVALLALWPISVIVLNLIHHGFTKSPVSLPPASIYSAIDAALWVGMLGYLLTSTKVARVYGTTTRQDIETTTPRLWRWLRGRHHF